MSLIVALTTILSFAVSCWLGFSNFIKSRTIFLDSPSDERHSRVNHDSLTPRVGGIGIMLTSILAITIGYPEKAHISSEPFRSLLMTTIFVFSIGLWDDLFGNIRVHTRLLLLSVMALVACLFSGNVITSIDFVFVDAIIERSFLFSLLFTTFAIVCLTNGYNIVDGLNGLSSGCALGAVIPIVCVSGMVGDLALMQLSAIFASSLIGFFIVNIFTGRVFLGDGGAYLIGFVVSFSAILLSERHPEVSPWFVVVLNSYAILETVFSVIRRKACGAQITESDAGHLHSLIFGILRYYLKRSCNSYSNRRINSLASITIIFFVAICSFCAIPLAGNTPLLIIFFASQAAAYLIVYFKVRSKLASVFDDKQFVG